MHRYLLNGESHIANSSRHLRSIRTRQTWWLAYRLPQRLQPPASLSSIHAKLVIRPRRTRWSQPSQATGTPNYTSATSGTHYVGASDLATLFDTQPLLQRRHRRHGRHASASSASTDILLSDVQIYRSLFGLAQERPHLHPGRYGDPGTNADDGESDLDVELSGALAPGASIHFVTSGNSYFGGGIDAAAVYLVDNNSADIISLSYGLCEVKPRRERHLPSTVPSLGAGRLPGPNRLRLLR